MDRELGKARALRDFPTFRQRYRGRDTPAHQREMIDFVEATKYALILEPRTHGKSETLTIDYTLWRICRDTNIRILIVAQDDGFATDFMRPVRHELVFNERLRADFGIGPLLEESAHQLVVPRTINHKDPTVAAAGWGGAITGRKADLIICDDLFDKGDAMSPAHRENMKRWFLNELINCEDKTNPGGKVAVVGTTKHYDDLYALLRKKDEFQCLRRQVIVDEEKKLLLWPERFAWDDVMKLKDMLGPIYFSSEFMNDPTPLEGELLKAEWLHYWTEHPEDLEIRFGVDPAISTAASADFSAIAVVGRSKSTGIMYVLQVWTGKVDFPGLLKEIQKWATIWGPTKIFVEQNAYQAAIVQASRLVSNLPIIGVKTTKDKVTRMIALSPHFQAGRIQIRAEQEEVIEQFLQFPKGAHDDCLDAIEICVHEWCEQGDKKYGGVAVDWANLLR